MPTRTLDQPADTEYDFEEWVGISQPALEVHLTNDDGSDTNLSGATVRFQMWSPGSDTFKVDSQMLITDATGGMVEYNWASSDTDTAGSFNGRIAVDFSGDTGSNFDADEYWPSENTIQLNFNEPTAQ